MEGDNILPNIPCSTIPSLVVSLNRLKAVYSKWGGKGHSKGRSNAFSSTKTERAALPRYRQRRQGCSLSKTTTTRRLSRVHRNKRSPLLCPLWVCIHYKKFWVFQKPFRFTPCDKEWHPNRGSIVTHQRLYFSKLALWLSFLCNKVRESVDPSVHKSFLA